MQTPNTKQLSRYHQGGFTLIELLIVIAIIAILAAIAVPQYGNYLDRSERSACLSELSSYRSLAMSTTAIGASDAEVPDFDFQSCNPTETQITELDNKFRGTNEPTGTTQITTQSRGQIAYVSANGQITAEAPAVGQ
ncbi:prepilin-type N-terminal cleavage/methylation domain-containing protein [Vreelandella sp. EE22]